MGMLQEFKEFAMKGNVVDMAVGIIIGGAFGKIVSSIVSDVIMPPIGLLLGGVNFTELKIKLADAVTEGPNPHDAVTINYGNFLQVTVDFIIVAFAIFLMVKAMNSLSKKKKEEAPAAPPAPSEEVKLLTEIRDALKK